MNIDPAGRAWIDAVLSTPGADARRKFDIANIHLRAPAAKTAAIVCSWRRYFAAKDFTGPLWITEAGYPANPAWQTDPTYQGGAAAQAHYLATAIPDMIAAGAAKVFITERDSMTGPYASEGFLQTPDPLPNIPAITRRPSFNTIQQLTHRDWTQVTPAPNRCTSKPGRPHSVRAARTTRSSST
jgi:hypothetical protein